MKVLIIDSIETLKKEKNRIISFGKQIYKKGHNVFFSNKEGLYEHLNANVVLINDSEISFADALTIVCTTESGDGYVPEFLCFVSDLDIDTLRLGNSSDSNLNRMIRELGFHWYIINPKSVCENNIIDWVKVFDITAEHFKFSYQREEFDLLLKDFIERCENLDDRKVKEMKDYIERIPAKKIDGIPYINNERWESFVKKLFDVFGDFEPKS